VSEYEDRVIRLSDRPRALSAERCEARAERLNEAERDLPELRPPPL
jgi:hypothetical protein